MKKHLLFLIALFFTMAIKSQSGNFNALFQYSGSNYNSSKVIVNDKIYILNTDSDAYIINKLKLDGSVISSLKYYIGKHPVNNYYTSLKLYELNDKLLSVCFYDNYTTMIFVTDTLTGNVTYSNIYNFSYQGSELLDNGNLVVFGGGLITNINALTGSILSSFYYPSSFSNNGIRITSISKNNGASFIMSGAMYFSNFTAISFITKVSNNQTMLNSGFHLLPSGYSTLNSFCKDNDVYINYSSPISWGGYVINSVFKSDTIFNGILKNYQGVRAFNLSQSASSAGYSSLLVTNNNVLVSSTPNNLSNYIYTNYMHNQEVLSFDRNLNYIKSVQYPAYSYTQEPTPEIDYYKGETYTGISTSSNIPSVPLSWGADLQSFNYYWLHKGDSLGESSCSTFMSHTTSTLSINDSIITPYTFAAASTSFTNAVVSFSNTTVTPTIICNTTTEINDFISWHKINVFPNPASSVISIKIAESTAGIEAYRIKITDVLGREVLESEFKEQLNIAQFEKGIYFVCITQGSKTLGVKKIIKE